jgi:hypothetical protein
VLDLLMQHEGGQRLRLRPWHYLTLGVPVAYIGAVTGIALSDPSLRLQGWSDAQFSLRHARNMWLGWELWPLLAWLAYRRQLRTLALWLALPLFYFLWSRVLGRGLAPWYVIGPAAFACVASALALDQVYAASSGWARLQVKAAAARWAPRAAIALCLVCLAPIPLLGLLRVREQWRALDGRFPRPDAASQVQAVIAREQPESLLIVDCFWAYRYSHLRWRAPSRAAFWYNDQQTQEILQNAEASALIVTCKNPGHEPIDRRLREAPFKLLYEDAAYQVTSPTPRHAIRD